MANADRLVAFWNGRSRGTLNSIVLARRKGIPIEIVGADGARVAVELAVEAAERLVWSQRSRPGAASALARYRISVSRCRTSRSPV